MIKLRYPETASFSAANLLRDLAALAELAPVDDAAAVGGKRALVSTGEDSDGVLEVYVAAALAIEGEEGEQVLPAALQDAIAAAIAAHDPVDVAAPARPPAADAVLGALSELDPATASVADVIGVVKTALADAGARPV